MVQPAINLSPERLILLIQISSLLFQFHTVLNTAFNPHRIVRAASACFGNRVRCQKTEPFNLAQIIWVVLYHFQRIASEHLINFVYLSWSNLKRSQVGCQIPQSSSTLVGFQYNIQLFSCDTADLQQTVRIMLQNFKGSCSKTLCDQFRCSRSNPFHHSGRQVRTDAFLGLWADLLIPVHMVLQAVFSLNPFPIQFYLQMVIVREITPNCAKPGWSCPSLFLSVFCLLRDFLLCLIQKHAIAVLFILINGPYQFTSHLLFLSSCKR